MNGECIGTAADASSQTTPERDELSSNSSCFPRPESSKESAADAGRARLALHALPSFEAAQAGHAATLPAGHLRFHGARRVLGRALLDRPRVGDGNGV